MVIPKTWGTLFERIDSRNARQDKFTDQSESNEQHDIV
jgi:hypothetical protein